jgi:hypothetical protein
MPEKDTPSRFDTIIAVSVVIISIALALLVYRASLAASQGSGDDRMGMINLLKQQAALNENVRKLYEEMSYVREFELLDVRIKNREGNSQAVSQAEAKFLKLILPNLANLTPLSAEARYKNPDGSYKIEQRLNDLNEAFPETQLEPKISFTKADLAYLEQRWLMVAAVVMGLALFWTSLSEILSGKLKVVSYIVGIFGFIGGVGFLVIIELIILLGKVA